MEALKRLVKLDRSWIPEGEGYSLYIRPQIIATEVQFTITDSVFFSNVTTTSPTLGFSLRAMLNGMLSAVRLVPITRRDSRQ